ncbi:MAG TPA: CaiB/BaiF CoA-transferase family protein [Ramlibacter sp.]|nr:CaiB/BaiF CoA-transferase family protein [Ramlibacter sp.]
MSATRPLKGIRVLDLTVALAGPYGSLLLGGLGAEVIRVEAPGGGDIARTNPPFVGSNGISFNAPQGDEVSLTTLNRGRNKKSITLDLKTEQGREILMRLAKECDVVIENMSEGTTAKLKVDYEHIRRANPKIVYASIKAFGEPSPYPSLKGMDIIVQALSGLMEVTGFADGPPTRVGIPIADLVTPLFAVNGILSALIARGRTGEGQHVQVSMLDCLASMVAEEHFDVMGKAGYPRRSGNSHDRLVPFGVFPTRDGHVAIVAFSPEWMKALADAMGQPELLQDPRFTNRAIRMQHAAAFNAILEAWTRRHTSDEVVRELLEKRGVPTARVRTPDEVLHDPHLHESGAVAELEHPTVGKVDAFGMGLPIRFSKSEAKFDQPAMALGAANEEIYGQLLKLSQDEMAALRAAGII